jgi:hypothetical protein
MTITATDINSFEAAINAKLAVHGAQFKLTVHFSFDRLNDARNKPAITLAELQTIFDNLLSQHLASLLALGHGDTFNIRCLTSHINIPCSVEKQTSWKSPFTHIFNTVTVMRNKKFVAKDPLEFTV